MQHNDVYVLIDKPITFTCLKEQSETVLYLTPTEFYCDIGNGVNIVTLKTFATALMSFVLLSSNA